MKPKLCNRACSARKLVGWASTLLTLTLYPAASSAHSHLVRSQPAADATLKQAPRTIELWFSEELAPGFNAITVTDGQGKRVDHGDVTLSEGDKKLQIALQDLGSGTYTVDWKNLSADQHTMKGKFTFMVALPAAPTTPPSQAAQQSAPPVSPTQSTRAVSSEESGTPWTLSFMRWLEYLGMMSLVGGFALVLFVLNPALRGARHLEGADRETALRRGRSRFLKISWLSLAVLALATLAMLALQAATVLDVSVSEALAPARLSQVLTKTSFGPPWILQAAAVVVLALIVFLYGRREGKSAESSTLLCAGLIVGCVLLLAPSLMGHAKAAQSEWRFSILSDWLHLVAAAVWVGGLFHLVLVMPQTLFELGGRRRLHVLHRLVPLFTRLAVASTVLIAITGVYNSWVHVDGFAMLWHTSYGKAVLLKVLLFVPMIVLGGLNTFVIHPRASRLIDEEHEAETPEHSETNSRFYRSVAAEGVLGVLVLLVAAVLVFLPPARQHMTISRSVNPSLPVVENGR
jgi:copper transport protein